METPFIYLSRRGGWLCLWAMTKKPLIALALWLLVGCGCSQPENSGPTPLIPFDIVATHPHDPEAFTQGLLYHDGLLYESTGLYGQSSLRISEPETGKVRKRRMLDPSLFGEGLAEFNGRLYQLAWRENVVLVYDRDTLRSLRTLPLAGEGWGIAVANNQLVISDGTDKLHFYDPSTMNFIRSIPIRHNGKAVYRLNELEMIGDRLYANIWESDYIARIDLERGEVTGWIDASALYPRNREQNRQQVLNGIAHNPETGHLYLTGKNWPHLFEIRLKDEG